jgi:hypothetical protein
MQNLWNKIIIVWLVNIYFYCFRVAVEAFKSFLLCSKCEHVAEALFQCTHIDVGDSLASFIQMIPALTK